MANTGYQSPSANGDDHADWTDPTNAYASNDAYASAPGADDLHDYYTFGFSIPSGARIDGIRVSMEGHAFNVNGATIEVELSWDGGTSYTSTGYAAEYPDSTDETDVLGGVSDTWGRTWSVSEFGSADFRVRIDSDSSASRPFLDHVQVDVYYTLLPRGGVGVFNDPAVF